MSGWTDERVERLKALWKDGLSANQIATALGGISRNAVIGKVHRLGLSGRATPSRPRRTVFKTVKPPAARPSPPREIAPGAPTKLHPAGNRVYVVSEDRPLPAPSVEEVVGTATILTLGAHMCSWPIGDPKDENFALCGRRRDEPRPYCAQHNLVAGAPASGKKKLSTNDLMRSLRRYV